jgi:hypothetical protein
MFKFLKGFHFLQTLLIKIIGRIHPAVEHNISKIYAIKKAMYIANLEKIEGDYLEFGMFEGTSFIAAFETNFNIRMNGLIQRKFWGYDSFSGFKYFNENDRHPFFREGDFQSNFEKVNNRIKAHFNGRSPFKVTPGYVEETLGGKTPTELGMAKIAVAFIDLDLGGPAKTALDFMKPAFQEGTIIILDDYFSYRGSIKTGVAGAFEIFQSENPQFHFRRLLDYGYGGQAFILHEISR